MVIDSPKAQAGFNYSNMCSDAAFINSGTMNAQAIQNFLRSKGSFLQSYSQNGRSAAQIIYDSARSNRINPVTILATIQKEEGLITGTYSRSLNQTRVDWAMGYGYTDSGIVNESGNRGFTNQIDNGAWQLRRNYDYWAANGSAWNVGKTMIIDGMAIRFANRCTSSLYRYTPHLGTNFTYYFNLWNVAGAGAGSVSVADPNSYGAQFAAQGPRSGAGAPNVTLRPNQRFTIWVNYKNTGGATWSKGGAYPARIGTSSPQDRGSVFMGGGNLRGSLVQASVRPGQTGTFRITLTAPAQGGTYTERFRALAEHLTWMGEEANFTFNVSAGRNARVNGTNTSSSGVTSYYNAAYAAQGPRTGAGSPSYVLSRGQRVTLWVNYSNTGRTTWTASGANPTYLGTAGPQDRTSVFFGNNNLRSRLVQSSVAPGGTGTFRVNIIAPQSPGTYQETFRPLVEHQTWMGDTVTWTLQVR